jgi:hypothetical protein
VLGWPHSSYDGGEMPKNPTRGQLAELTLAALKDLGGRGTARDVRAKVAELGKLTREQVEAPGPMSSRTRTHVGHGVDWSLQNLRHAGLIENDGKRPATWSVTARGRRAGTAEVFDALRSPSTS